MWTGLTLRQVAPRRPASYGASRSLTITPSWPAARVRCRNASRVARVVGDQLVDPQPCRYGACEHARAAPAAAGPARRRRRGEGRRRTARSAGPRSTPPVPGRARVRRGPSCPGTAAVDRARRARAPRRRGRPERTGSERTAATTSGIRWVTSLRLRVNNRTASPDRWTCTRAPSSLASTDHGGGVGRTVASGERVGDRRRRSWPASARALGRPRARTPPGLAAPPRAAATAVTRRSPESIAARRTVGSGTSVARAIGGVSSPASAP